MDEKQSAAEAADAPRRRRVPPPTIDLEATSVSAPTGDAAAPESHAAESPGSTGGTSPSASSEAASSASSAENMTASTPAQGTAGESSPAGSGGGWRRFGPPLVAGVLGAVIALAGAAAWELLGAGTGAGRDGDTNARLTRIETQLDALAHRGAAPADAKTPGDLTARLGSIESKLAEQTAVVDREVKPLDEKLSDLTHRNDEIMAATQVARQRADAAAKSLADVAQQLTQLNAERAQAPQVQRADLDALSTRLASVESATKAIGEQLARRASVNGGDTRQAVVALALKSATERGVPYASELDAVRPFADAATLAALEPFAKGGVPSAAALAHEASALVPALVSAADTEKPQGVMARLWINAKRMMRLRPVGNVPGTGADAVIARLELKAAQGDLDGVTAEVGNLPAAARGPIEPWVKRVQARNAALTAADRLATGTLTRLGRDTTQNQDAPQR
jgi:hypothetical protein